MQHETFKTLINTTSRKVRTNAVAAGAGAAVLAGILSLGVAVACDITLSLPVVWRLLFSVTFWGSLVAVGIVLILWPMFRRLPTARVASWIETAIPGLHNRLISALALSEQAATQPVNPALLQHLLDETEERLADYQIQNVADPRPVRRLLAIAVVTALAGVAFMAAFQPRSTTALDRIFRPTAPILPPSWVQLRSVTGDTKVLKGEPLTIQATVLRGEPDSLQLRLRETDGQWVTYPMDVGQPNTFTFTLGSVEASYEYQILGPRTWTDVHNIRMMYRPVVESISAQIKLPDYTGIAAPQVVPEDTPQIEALVGSVVHLKVAVRRDASRGEVRLLKGVKKEETEILEHETVWVDDDLPENVEPIGTWQWSQKRAHSGPKSHTFTAEESEYGFTTKLNPLEIKPGETIIFYVWIDPDDPPKEFSIGLWVKGAWFSAWSQFDWGIKPDKKDKSKKRRLYVGPLPKAGQWMRMEVPIARAKSLKSMLERDKKGVISGLKFERNGGNVFFDKIAIHSRTTVTTERTEFQPAEVYPLQETQPGIWECSLPVAESYVQSDLRFTVDLENVLGYHNPRVKPVLLKAINDKPPTLIVDSPENELILGKPLPLPVTGQVFDDFGVQAIGYQVGTRPEEESLREPVWVHSFDEPARAQELKIALVTDKSGLMRDTPIYYRMLARDRKGQVGSTPLRQVELYAAELPEIAPLVEQAASLPDAHDAALISLSALKQTFDDAQGKSLSAGSDSSRIALSSGGWEKWADSNKEGLTPEQSNLVKQLAGQLDTRNESLTLLAGSLRRGGIFTIHLDLALPFKSSLFQIMSIQASALLMELPPQLPSHRDIRERIAAIEKMAERQALLLRSLHTQLSEFQKLNARWEASPWPPKTLQQEADTLLTKAWGNSLMQEISMIQRHAATVRDLLRTHQQQLDRVIAQTIENEPDKLSDARREQEAIDPGLINVLRRTTELVEPFMTPEEKSVKLPTPWPHVTERDDSNAKVSLAEHQKTMNNLLGARKVKLEEIRVTANQVSDEVTALLEPWDGVDENEVARLKQILRSDEVRLLLKVADQVLADLYPQFARGDRTKLREKTMAVLQGKKGSEKKDGQDGLKDKQHLLPKEILRRLLEGETLKGPPAYQELIDSYFRSLSQEHPEESAP